MGLSIYTINTSKVEKDQTPKLQANHNKIEKIKVVTSELQKNDNFIIHYKNLK